VNAAVETTVLEEIRKLLNAPADGAGAPTLARLEDTLTDGYAQALALEAERLRLERRLGEVAREADAGDPSRLSAELTLLASRLTRADGELAKLRALLGSLVERTRTQRRLAAQN
jgi:ABC-type phosphate transport system auxiliary subunit